MRVRFAAPLLLVGCSLIKVDVSTPETRRQEYELANRKAAATPQTGPMADAEARRQTALADQTAARERHDAQVIDSVEKARADVAAKFTADGAIALAQRIRDAETSAPARDGRLDMPALWREATQQLERAAATPSHPAFLSLIEVPASPERDAAVLRACPQVRQAVPADAVPDFYASCLLAAGDDARKLQWPGVKSDLAAYRKAEDARLKREAEAREAAVAQAKTLAFAVLPLFAGGRCRFGDCASNGWSATVEGGDLSAQCRFSKCLVDGWTTSLPDGTSASTTCRFSDCNKDGWDTSLPDGRTLRTSCSFGDCARNGWDLQLPDGNRVTSRCSGSDCYRDGWTTSFPDGRSVRCRCEFGDCKKNGAVCQ